MTHMRGLVAQLLTKLTNEGTLSGLRFLNELPTEKRKELLHEIGMPEDILEELANTLKDEENEK